MRLLETRALVKAYKKRRVVDRVDIVVKKGEVVGLLGPNGAGKTTTFYMIVGLIKPDKGKVIFDAQDITGLPMYRRAKCGIGYLSQEPSVFAKLSVEDNIMAVLETIGLPRSERYKRREHLLRELGLAELAKSVACTLSGGERRRLEITRALVTNPSFILLDEPFSGVDPIAVADVQQIIAQLKAKGIGVLLTDHSVRETLSISDRSYIMAEGKILISGEAEDLINDPKARQIYLGEKFKM